MIERASVLFNDRSVSGDNVKENLLRLKVLDPEEEQDELWAATTDLVEPIDKKEEEADSLPIPNQSNTRIGFFILIKWILEASKRNRDCDDRSKLLEKTDGMVSQASDALKLRRTTLIEKNEKIWNFKIKKSATVLFVGPMHLSTS